VSRPRLGANLLSEVAALSCIQGIHLANFLVLIHLNENLDLIEPYYLLKFSFGLCAMLPGRLFDTTGKLPE
jgi:hypothetical protein